MGYHTQRPSDHWGGYPTNGISLQDIDRFGRAIFKAADFMEPIAFDRLEIEAIPDSQAPKPRG